MRLFPSGLLLSWILTGCGGTQSLYHWGHYEDLLHAMYTHPGKAEPPLQIEILSQDIDRAHASGQAVPPGVHAHLGYLLSLQGHMDAARREFETEKSLYPESARFMDQLMKGMTE